MASLQRMPGGPRITLGAHHLVGRAPICHLQLDDELVSSTHAELRWSGTAWVVRDLHSLNGTTVNGAKVREPHLVELGEGDILVFGTGQERWKIIDTRPPRAAALSESGERVEAYEEGVLSLPPGNEHECQIFRLNGRWLLERDGAQHEAEDQQTLVIDGTRWTLELPPAQGRAVGATRKSDNAGPLPRNFGNVTLRFTVSRNLEYIGLCLECDGWRHDFEGRAFNETMFVLALTRLKEREQTPEQPGDDIGWLTVDHLCTKASLTSTRELNLHVFRARKQFEKAGVADASRLVERRRVSSDSGMLSELRLGTERIVIDRHSS